MKTLNYKGFIGSIEKEEDNTFYGKVLDTHYLSRRLLRGLKS